MQFYIFCPLGYWIGVPVLTDYRELPNTDCHHYGRSNVANLSHLRSESVPMHGQEQSLILTSPPLAFVIIQVANG